jgi:hypothetical protein
MDQPAEVMLTAAPPAARLPRCRPTPMRGSRVRPPPRAYGCQRDASDQVHRDGGPAASMQDDATACTDRRKLGVVAADPGPMPSDGSSRSSRAPERENAPPVEPAGFRTGAAERLYWSRRLRNVDGHGRSLSPEAHGGGVRGGGARSLPVPLVVTPLAYGSRWFIPCPLAQPTSRPVMSRTLSAGSTP